MLEYLRRRNPTERHSWLILVRPLESNTIARILLKCKWSAPVLSQHITLFRKEWRSQPLENITRAAIMPRYALIASKETSIEFQAIRLLYNCDANERTHVNRIRSTIWPTNLDMDRRPIPPTRNQAARHDPEKRIRCCYIVCDASIIHWN